MEFKFLSIQGDATKHITQVLTNSNSQPSENEIESIVANAVDNFQNEIPVIAKEEDFFSITREQRIKIDVAKRCAIQEVADEMLLLENEEIKEDFFSYLLEPFHNLPKYTGVLKRTTNKAVVMFFFPLVKIDAGSLVHLTPIQPKEFEMPLAKGISVMITGELVKKLLGKAAQKVGGAIAGKLGAIIINLVMKELFGDDKQKMLDDIRRIVKAEIEENEIAKIEGAIEGTIQFLTVEYKNMKAKANLSDVNKRRELLENLKPYSHKFYTDVIGVLKQSKYAVRGLKTFAIGSAVHLIITQEMAMIDPDEMNPNNSGYLLTLRSNATTYREHLEANFNKTVNGRRAQISVFEYTEVLSGGGNMMSTKITYGWKDTKIDKVVKGFVSSKDPKKSVRENAEASMQAHKNKVINKLIDDLGNPKEMAIPSLRILEKFSFPKS